MKFDQKLLMNYKTLLQTTDLEKSYQEFIRLFRFIRIELEKNMTQYKFQSNIVENGMDYSYFQLTDEELKKTGLKIAIVFVHKTFQFEVWLSGYNRKVQCKYYELFKDDENIFLSCNDPKKNDYILKLSLDCLSDFSDGNNLVNIIKEKTLELIEYGKTKSLKIK